MRLLMPLLLLACSATPKDEEAGDGFSPKGPSSSDTGSSSDDDPDDPDADSDGDGFTDGEEHASNTDPEDPEDHPYAGGWPIDACRDSVQPTGDRAGDVANGWTRMDQFGEQISLHDFCEHTVLLVGSAFW